MKTILSETRPAIAAVLILAALTCGVYPLVVTLAAQTVFKEQANGSLISNKDGVPVGSALLGQNFTSERYFHPRPSAAGGGYDGVASGGSNLGPTSQKLHDQVQQRIAAYRAGNGLAADAEVPADAVTASGSGLDPHISLKNAELQTLRVAQARGLRVDTVREAIQASIDKAGFGFLGEAGVNVLKLNLALDSIPQPASK